MAPLYARRMPWLSVLSMGFRTWTPSCFHIRQGESHVVLRLDVPARRADRGRARYLRSRGRSLADRIRPVRDWCDPAGDSPDHRQPSTVGCLGDDPEARNRRIPPVFPEAE